MQGSGIKWCRANEPCQVACHAQSRAAVHRHGRSRCTLVGYVYVLRLHTHNLCFCTKLLWYM